jgi:hypothetical protein
MDFQHRTSVDCWPLDQLRAGEAEVVADVAYALAA